MFAQLLHAIENPVHSVNPQSKQNKASRKNGRNLTEI